MATASSKKLTAGWLWPLVHCLLLLPDTWVLVSILGAYLSYYEMGVNGVANSYFLVYFAAPAGFLVMAVASFFGYRLMRALTGSSVPALIAVAITVVFHLVVLACLFMGFVMFYADYPTEPPQNLSDFLHYVAGHSSEVFLGRR